MASPFQSRMRPKKQNCMYFGNGLTLLCCPYYVAILSLCGYYNGGQLGCYS